MRGSRANAFAFRTTCRRVCPALAPTTEHHSDEPAEYSEGQEAQEERHNDTVNDRERGDCADRFHAMQSCDPSQGMLVTCPS